MDAAVHDAAAAAAPVATPSPVAPSPKLFDKSINEASEKLNRTAHEFVQHAGENLDQTAKATHVMARGYPAIASALADFAKQAAHRNSTVLSQMFQARTFNDRLQLQSQYVWDSLEAALKTNARIAQVSLETGKEVKQMFTRRQG